MPHAHIKYIRESEKTRVAHAREKESVVLEPSLRDFFLDGHWRSNPRPRPKTFKFLGVAGGTIERLRYSPTCEDSRETANNE